MNWLNVELTNNCNKSCYFCGRVKARKEGTIHTGYMDMNVFEDIVEQFDGTVMQFNKDGEPLLHPHIRLVGKLTSHLVTNIVTNGKLLWEKREDLKDNFTTVTVSVFEDDEEQLEIVRKFVEFTKNPRVLIKFLGDYENKAYEEMGLTVMRRTLHDSNIDKDYFGSQPPIPELGVCLDFLFKPSIDWEGNVFICNRFDPEHKGMIGNVKRDTLDWILDSPMRNEWKEHQLSGRRDLIPLCKECEFWGIPTNG